MSKALTLGKHKRKYEKVNMMDYIVDGFVSTLLEDMQYRENEEAFDENREPRDIEELSDCCKDAIKHLVDEIIEAIGPKLWAHFCEIWGDEYKYAQGVCGRQGDVFGCNLYMDVVGHGTGIWDRQLEGDKAYKLVEKISDIVLTVANHVEFYIGDDGLVYWFGEEK